MKKYNLIKGESLQRYAELRINEKDIISADKPSNLYSVIIAWVKDLTSGDINLTPGDFLLCKDFLLLNTAEGSNYMIYASVDTRSRNLVTIYRKVNPYSIVYA